MSFILAKTSQVDDTSTEAANDVFGEIHDVQQRGTVSQSFLIEVGVMQKNFNDS